MEIQLIIFIAAAFAVAVAAYFAGKKSVHIPDRSEELAGKEARIEALMGEVRELASQRDVSRANEENAARQLEYVQGEAAKQLEQVRSETVRQLEQVRSESARQLEQVRGEAARQLVEVKQDAQRQLERERGEFRQQQAETKESYDRQLTALKEGNEKLLAEAKVSAEKRIEAMRNAQENQIAALKEMNREQMESQLKLIKEQMQTTSEKVLKMRQEELGAVNREQVSKIMDPVNESFKQIREQMAKMEESMQKANTESAERKVSITQTIEALAKETMKVGEQAGDLAKALKNKGKVQGDWGEQVLENILEGSGLRRGEDYLVQHNVKGEENENLRPDVIVKCPGDKSIVIDSKVSLTAYLDYVSADTPEEQKRSAKENLDSIKKHIDELSAKNYEKLVGNTISHVLMFIPNEGSYILALQADPKIAQYAFGKNVLLINPTNLMMSLKLIYNIWQSERQSRNVETIVAESTGLYEKFAGFLESFSDIGNKIETLHNSFSKAESQLCLGKGNLIKRVEGLKEKGILPKKNIPDKFIDKARE